MRLIIPDACVLGAAFFPETHSVQARAIRDAIQRNTIQAVAPACLHYEFLNICRKKYNRGKNAFSKDQISAIVQDFLRLDILLIDTRDETAEAWANHITHNVSPFDYLYIHAARMHDAELWTKDRGLLENGKGLYPKLYDLATVPVF